MNTETLTSDKLRAVAVVTAAAAQVLAPILGPALGQRPSGEVSGLYPTITTPPDFAFGIWFPIYTGCAAAAIQQALPGAASSEMNRKTGWFLTGAYTMNTIWALVEQSGKFKRTALILPVTVALIGAAYSRLQRSETTPSDNITPSTTGLFLGWTSLAAVVNIAAAGRARGAKQTSPAVVAASTAALLGTGAAIATVVKRSPRGSVALAVAATWGLANIALATQSAAVRVAATTAATTVTATLAANGLADIPRQP